MTPFSSLDFVYSPSPNVASELESFDQIGAEIVFAIEAFGARVAMVRLAEGPPDLVLADHLEGDRPILVYQVPELGAAAAELRKRGLEVSAEFGIPHGPCCELTTPGGHRIAIYELTRPGAPEHLAGRRDF